MIKSIEQADVNGKKVILRSDFNVPVENGIVRGFQKINDSLSTIDSICDRGGIPIIISHFGRPPKSYDPEFSIKPVADYFRGALGYNVHFATSCVGPSAESVVANAKKGDVVFFENVRFHKEEIENSVEFAREISKFGDIYCNNAFGTAHRAHATTAAITQFFPVEKYAGFLMLTELEYMKKALENPKRLFTAIIGGAKISGKIDVIFNLFNKCDNIIIGGGMMFTFFKARGYEIGKSLVENDKINLAIEIMEYARENDVRLYLPIDVVEADKFASDANYRIVHRKDMNRDWMGLDIGPESIIQFSRIIRDSKTIIWNGPMGVFEIPNFARGTLALARAVGKCTQNGGTTIVGGGDSARAIKQLNYEHMISHISTGGGASLELLEGKILPGVAALEIEE